MGDESLTGSANTLIWIGVGFFVAVTVGAMIYTDYEIQKNLDLVRIGDGILDCRTQDLCYTTSGGFFSADRKECNQREDLVEKYCGVE